MPVNKGALEVLEKQKTLNGTYVFCSPVLKRRIKKDDPYNELQRVLAILIITGTVRTFRHTFISHLAINGVPLATIAELLGHKNIKTTRIYAHLSKNHLSDSVAELDGLVDT